MKAFRGSADPKPGILLLSAAPGAGKTEAIVRALAREIPMNPNMRVVFCTHSNMALKRLVEAAAPKLKKIKQLIVLSSPAKEEYGSYFAPYSRNLLLATVEEILEEFKEKEEREAGEKSDEQRLLKYKQSCEERPGRADERGALKLVLKRRPVLPQVIYATTAMLEDLEMITEQVTHIVMDEAGKTSWDQTIPIVTSAPLLEKIAFVGDPQQTLNYVEDVPEFVRKFGTESMLTYLVKLNPREVTRVKLI